MDVIGEGPVQIDEQEEEEQEGRGDGYPAKRQRLVRFPDGPGDRAPERNAISAQNATSGPNGVAEDYTRAVEARAKSARNNARPRVDNWHEAVRQQVPARPADNEDVPAPPDASDLVNNASHMSGTATSHQPQSAGLTAVGATATAPERAAAADLVCFGMIPHVRCKILHRSRSGTADAVLTSAPDMNYLSLNLIMQRGRFIVGTESCRKLANLNTRITNALLEVTKLAAVKCEMFAERHQLTPALSPATYREWSDYLYVDVNIIGPVDAGQRIGNMLSQDELFLQDPRVDYEAMDYRNPQMLDLDVSESEILLHELFKEMTPKRSRTDPGSAWNTALDNMSQHALSANAVHIDASIVITPMLQHQKNALDFMCQRELSEEDLNSSMRFWAHNRTDENGKAIYRHTITADEEVQPQVEPKGGILADEMGLGKTLTAMSLVVSSRERAHQFATHRPLDTTSLPPTQLLRSRATLVAVPSTQLMDSWLKQVQQHIQAGTLSVFRYHGHERVHQAEALGNYDIVITTYGTIAKECSKPGRQVLYYMCFYRIILDEAHLIRNPRSKLFKAVVELQAVHHWCLTGTPVSNKIDDLYSLLSFCRVPLLENESIFQKHVTAPSKRSFQRGCDILRDTLRPICLRRNKGIIGLANPEAIEIEVQFSPIESKHYRRILERGRGAIDGSVSGRTSKSTRNIMLKILLELRIFCSQGTFRQDKFMADEQPLDSDELFTLLEESEDTYCVSCCSEVSGIDQVDDESSGVLGTCSHILCAACYSSQASEGTPKQCPTCKQTFLAQRLVQTNDPANASSAEVKHSCKLDKLVQDLLSSQNARAPEKSIVFSYWRKTIDLAADLCSRSSIRALVVHGKTPQAERTKTLEQFAEDPTISALLMTIGTGGLGLTINAASRVHLLEPQWNPTVEDQAIGRVVRLGQDKPITVIRYIVKDSVERQIQGYQRRKKALAASGFGHRSDNTSAEETVRLNAAYIA